MTNSSPSPIFEPCKSGSKADQLLFLIECLLAENEGRAFQDNANGTTPLDDIIAKHKGDEKALFRIFRGLVNARPPIKPTSSFIMVQNALLKSMIAEKGITGVSDIKRSTEDARIAVWRGDITTIAADAIVNAANSKMLGCWQPNHICIDNTIHTFAGVQLRLACDEFMRKQGRDEETGLAKITPAFNLPAKYVLHTVGPIVMGALNATYIGQLASCYISCLNLAAENGCRSVAFCCISTGVFMFPQDKAAEIAVRTVRSWLDSHPDSSIELVIFDVFSEKDQYLYDRQLNPGD